MTKLIYIFKCKIDLLKIMLVLNNLKKNNGPANTLTI